MLHLELMSTGFIPTNLPLQEGCKMGDDEP